MLKFENIQKRFGKLHVLKGVNLTLPDSQVVAIIGPNGSGKTTMLKSLLGLVIPDSGEITLNDVSIKNDWKYRHKLGYMSQISRFPENITIQELLEMMKDIRQDVTEYDEELYHIFKVEKMLEKKLGTLSGGTKQKISAVLAFMFQPKIVVLDEPTAGLDPLATEHIKQKIAREKQNGKLILITSHIMSDIEELADSVVYILDGNIKLHATVAEIKQQTAETTFGKAMAKIVEGYND